MYELHIGTPYIKKIGERVRLCAEILEGDKRRELFYEVASENSAYLCTERTDAFLISLIHYAMSKGMNITWEQPVTERLAYQLRTMYIPTISSKFNKFFDRIILKGPETSEEIKKNQWAVGTGASGGVDSFYAILKHVDKTESSQKLTHLLYVSMSNHSDSEERLRQDFETNLKYIRKIAKEVGLPLIDMFTNESSFFFNENINWGAPRYTGMVYALQNLFSVYYFASGYPYYTTTFGDGSANFDSAHFDLFILMSLSTRSLNIAGSGGETTRAKKVQFIENNDVVRNNLYVCNYENQHNCSVCDKCMRTMIQLQADGCLNEFKQVFDIEKFNKNYKKYVRKLLYRKSPYDREILSDMKRRGIRLEGRCGALVVRPIYLLWQKIKKSDCIMSVFYALNIDYWLYGEKMAESIRYTKGIPYRQEKNENN